jgi:pimeloyl-ACP methyl ester carboxylesterase
MRLARDADVRPRAVVGVVLVLLALAAAGPACADERVDVTAMDGVQLIGELAGTAGPGVVLVHGARSDRRRWAAVARALVARGYRVLRIDLRGHGESGGTVDLAAADRDVEGAYRYVLGRKIRPVFLVGEGVGGSAVLVVASRVPVAAVATLGRQPASDGPNPRGALAALGMPTLFLVDEADQDTKRFAAGIASSRIVVVPEPDLTASPRTVPALVELFDSTAR